MGLPGELISEICWYLDELSIKAIQKHMLVDNYIIKRWRYLMLSFDRCIQLHYNDVIEYAIMKGYDPSMGDNMSLKVAIEYRNVEIVARLLNDDRVELHDNNFAYIHIDNRVDILLLLLGTPNNTVTAANYNKCLRYFIKNGHVASALCLIKDSRVDPSNGVFQLACANELVSIVKVLLKDSKVNPRNNYDKALEMACERGHYDIVKLLLDDDRFPSLQNHYYHGFIDAVKMGHIDIVKLCIPNKNDMLYSNIFTTAVGYNQIDIIRLLLEDKTWKPRHMISAVRRAANNGKYNILKMLLSDPRCDPNYYILPLDSPLCEACKSGNRNIVNLLLNDYQFNPREILQWAILAAHQANHQDIVYDLLHYQRVNNIPIRIKIDLNRSYTNSEILDMEADYINNKIYYINNGTFLPRIRKYLTVVEGSSNCIPVNPFY